MKEFLSTDEISNKSMALKRAWLAFFLGGICMSIRFTCLAAYIPMGIILARRTQSAFTYLFLVCALSGLFGFLLTIILDRVMFGVWYVHYEILSIILITHVIGKCCLLMQSIA